MGSDLRFLHSKKTCITSVTIFKELERWSDIISTSLHNNFANTASKYHQITILSDRYNPCVLHVIHTKITNISVIKTYNSGMYQILPPQFVYVFTIDFI